MKATNTNIPLKPNGKIDMIQLYLDFNTIDSTEDQPCTIEVDSVEHAKRVLRYIGFDRIQSAEVYDWVYDEFGDELIPRPHTNKEELLRTI